MSWIEKLISNSGLTLVVLGIIVLIPGVVEIPALSIKAQDTFARTFLIVLGSVLIIAGIFGVAPWRSGKETKQSDNNPEGKDQPKSSEKVKAQITTNYPPAKFSSKSINGDIGYGIKIGGTYSNEILEVFSSEWGQYATSSVKSGWLYVTDDLRDVSHAVLFFKVHLSNDGKGYIHLESVARPSHFIWLKTSVEVRKEGLFCFEGQEGIQKDAVWQFRWK